MTTGQNITAYSDPCESDRGLVQVLGTLSYELPAPLLPPASNVLPFPKTAETTEASLADIVLENNKVREAQAVAQQLPQLPQPVEPEESGDDEAPPASAA